MNNRGGMLGANPAIVNPDGMEDMMEEASYDHPEEEIEEEQAPEGNQNQYAQQVTAQPQQMQQHQMMPAPQPMPYQNPETGSIIPHYATGGHTTTRRNTMQNMPDLDLINQRPGYDMYEDDNDMEESSEPEMILAHLSPTEMHELDEMQGGRIIDEFWNCPSYKGCIPFIGTPEILAIFKDVVEEIIETGELSPEKQAFVAELDPIFPLAGQIPVDGPSSYRENGLPQDLQTVAHEGINGDTTIALIPKSLSNLLDEMRGSPSANPVTKLPQYFWGALLIGGIGAAMKYFGDKSSQNSAYKKALEQQRRIQEDYERRQKEEIEKEKIHQRHLLDRMNHETRTFSENLYNPTKAIDDVLKKPIELNLDESISRG